MVKVLFIECSDFETFPLGGQLTYLKGLLRWIDVEPYLVGVTLKGHVNRPRIWQKKTISGIKCFFMSIGLVNPNAGFLDGLAPYRLRFLLWLRRYRNAIMDSKPDILFFQTQESILVFLNQCHPPKVLRLAGATNPLKGSRFSWARGRAFQKVYEWVVTRQVLPRVTKVIAINRDCVELCEKMGNFNYSVIPIGVDESVFYPRDRDKCRENLKLPSQAPILVFVGRLSKIKGLDLLIDGFSLFIDYEPQAKLLIVGDGEERSAVQTKVSKMGLRESVYLLGNVEHSALPEVLSASDVFAITSLAEGVPNAVLEAMACGLPIVATNVGGIPEVIKDGFNGVLISRREPHEVASALRVALRDRNVLGLNALRAVEERYSMRVIAREVTELFLSIMGDQRR